MRLENQFFEFYSELPDVAPGPIVEPLGVKEWLKTKFLKPIILPWKNIIPIYAVVLAIVSFIILKVSGSSFSLNNYLTSVGITTTLGFIIPGIPTAVVVYLLSLVKLKDLEARSCLESDSMLMKKYKGYTDYVAKMNSLKEEYARKMERMNEIVAEAAIYVD